MKRLVFAVLAVMAILFNPISVNAQAYYLEADGIGPIKTGMFVKSIAKSVNGLYDNVNVVTEYDDFEDMTYIIATFSMGGNDLFYARATEDGQVYDVKPISQSLKSKSGAYVDMPARKFIQLPGVVVSVNPNADYNHVSFEIDGIQIGIDESFYTSTGKKKAATAVRTGKAPQFTPQDFTPEAAIMLGGFMM